MCIFQKPVLCSFSLCYVYSPLANVDSLFKKYTINYAWLYNQNV